MTIPDLITEAQALNRRIIQQIQQTRNKKATRALFEANRRCCDVVQALNRANGNTHGGGR